eukprot:1376350-Rhodomonas_salina.2
MPCDYPHWHSTINCKQVQPWYTVAFKSSSRTSLAVIAFVVTVPELGSSVQHVMILPRSNSKQDQTRKPNLDCTLITTRIWAFHIPTSPTFASD